VQTTVDESDIGRISIGQEATFTVDAYPDERFTGTVSQIRLAPVTISNVVNYTVVIDVVNDKLKLMPGMTANVRILVGSARDVLRVSNMALRFQPPAELVDSAKVKEMMAAGGGPGGGGMAGGTGGGEGWRGRQGGGGEGGGERGGMMRAIRDSIVASHGGQMSEEDLRAEMRKVFEKMRPGSRRQSAPAATIVPARPGAATRFGIQVNFPEYQKSAYVPVQRNLRGRVWMMGQNGKLEPVTVTTGLTDGRYTEIAASSLKVGDQLVLGASSNSGQQTTQVSNVLSGQGQRGGPMGGGPPR